MMTKAKRDDEVLQMGKQIEENYFQLTNVTRNVLTISTIDVNCEKIFNIVGNLYDHRCSYDFETFEIIMIIRAYDQRKNVIAARLHADLKKKSNEKTINQKSIDEMKKRAIALHKSCTNMKYINENENVDVAKNDFNLNASQNKIYI